MMLPSTVPTFCRLLPTIPRITTNVRPMLAHAAPAALEFVALGSFIAMCIGLIVEFS